MHVLIIQHKWESQVYARYGELQHLQHAMLTFSNNERVELEEEVLTELEDNYRTETDDTVYFICTLTPLIDMGEWFA